jgi:hypothetical protein
MTLIAGLPPARLELFAFGQVTHRFFLSFRKTSEPAAAISTGRASDGVARPDLPDDSSFRFMYLARASGDI